MAQINKPNLHFNTKLFTGNGSNGHAITGVGFQPDFCWLKNRSLSQAHVLVDAVRGNNKILYTNGDGAETTTIADKDFRSFDSDGFTVDANNDFGSTNTNGSNIVSWNWKGANSSGTSNSDGSITSTVSANTTAGFSIVSYTGTGATATIGHGLGVAPKMIIIKQRSASRNWVVGHDSIGWTKYLYLDSNQASATGNFFNDTTPSSTVFNVVNDSGVNASGGTYIAYCFAEKKGYSKFGSYTGNASADGTFVYTGFKPAFLIVKRSDGGTENWGISDNQRLNNSGNQDGGNGNYVPHMLATNSSNAESNFGGGSSNEQDYLSNGFKIRSANAYANTGGATYIYMAFAENPIVGSNDIPATAR